LISPLTGINWLKLISLLVSGTFKYLKQLVDNILTYQLFYKEASFIFTLDSFVWYNIRRIRGWRGDFLKIINRNMKKVLSLFILFSLFTGLLAQEKFTDKRDGNVYHTITISGVTWIAENLKYKPKSGAFYFDNDFNNIPGYGVLYEWGTAIQLGGMQDYEGTFSEMDESGYYWTSTEYDKTNA
jgi:hypothetical protein